MQNTILAFNVILKVSWIWKCRTTTSLQGSLVPSIIEEDENEEEDFSSVIGTSNLGHGMGGAPRIIEGEENEKPN